jgi:hypothetical protein
MSTASSLNASYATRAGTAESATYASKAGQASNSTHAKNAVNSTYAQVAKEAEKLNFGGTTISIDANQGIISFSMQGMTDPIMLDIPNRTLYNLELIANTSGAQICPYVEPIF